MIKIKLPKVSIPLANYLPYTIANNFIFVSGQLPMEDGKVKFVGRLGENVSLEEGVEAARTCMLNVLAHVENALGSLDKITKCLKVTGFVSSTPDFIDHPKVINGASDLLAELLNEKGKHARAAVGVSSLPLGAAVEVEAIFEINID